MKLCMRAKFGSMEASKQLLTLKRNIYFNVDKLPFEPKAEYLQYLADEKRLPRRLLPGYTGGSSNSTGSEDEQEVSNNNSNGEQQKPKQ